MWTRRPWRCAPRVCSAGAGARGSARTWPAARSARPRRPGSTEVPALLAAGPRAPDAARDRGPAGRRAERRDRPPRRAGARDRRRRRRARAGGTRAGPAPRSADADCPGPAAAPGPGRPRGPRLRLPVCGPGAGHGGRAGRRGRGGLRGGPVLPVPDVLLAQRDPRRHRPGRSASRSPRVAGGGRRAPRAPRRQRPVHRAPQRDALRDRTRSPPRLPPWRTLPLRGHGPPRRRTVGLSRPRRPLGPGPVRRAGRRRRPRCRPAQVELVDEARYRGHAGHDHRRAGDLRQAAWSTSPGPGCSASDRDVLAQAPLPASG